MRDVQISVRVSGLKQVLADFFSSGSSAHCHGFLMRKFLLECIPNSVPMVKRNHKSLFRRHCLYWGWRPSSVGIMNNNLHISILPHAVPSRIFGHIIICAIMKQWCSELTPTAHLTTFPALIILESSWVTIHNHPHWYERMSLLGKWTHFNYSYPRCTRNLLTRLCHV